MNDEIVRAHPDDAPGAACLIAATDADLFRWYTRGDLDLWAAIAECEWRADHGIYSHTMSHVIRRQGEVVGLFVAYSSRRQATIDWSLAGSRARLGSARLRGIDLVQSPAAYLFSPLPGDAFYVQNVATHPSVQGGGLGRRLMEQALELGRAEGCRTCHLDVDSSTQAVRFYEHLGFLPLVRTEVLTIQGVHAHYRMVIELS
jgi:ribosomal protein S18 acetylase RimI-like enzyme